MSEKYIMAIDQGTTSTRTLITDKGGNTIAVCNVPFGQIYPEPGWVEHNPAEIMKSVYESIETALKTGGIPIGKIGAIGITNQRETTVIWDRETGEPVYNAIVWQCRRTKEICDKLVEDGYEDYIRESTGLLPDAYFSATKIKWILDNVEGVKEKAERGKLAFGTIDTWILWNLTNGRVHATDYSNASRTMLYNISEMEWDGTLLEILGIPRSLLPEVKETSGHFGTAEAGIFKGRGIHITACAGDQQAALFGQGCFDAGNAKNTYGTGCFLLMNTGENRIKSKNGLISTIAWRINGKVEYALEGSVFIGGAVLQWLRDEMALIKDAAETSEIAGKVPDTGGVYIVPAFSGIGAPYWDMEARGTITGITRGTNKNHIIRAALESIAYQTKDVLRAMEEDSGIKLKDLKVDGGASANEFLMQFQADILGVAVKKPYTSETTAIGAAFLAGLGSGIISGTNVINERMKIKTVYEPKMELKEVKKLYGGWKKAVNMSLHKG